MLLFCCPRKPSMNLPTDDIWSRTVHTHAVRKLTAQTRRLASTFLRNQKYGHSWPFSLSARFVYSWLLVCAIFIVSATSSWEPETYYFVVTWIFHVMGRISQRLSGWYDYLWLSQIHLNKADGNPYKPFYDYSIPYEPFLEMFQDQYQTWEARSPMFIYEALAVAWKLYLPGVFFLLGAGGWAPSFKGIGSQVDGIMWTLWYVILMWKYDTWSQTTGQIMKVCTSYVL